MSDPTPIIYIVDDDPAVRDAVGFLVSSLGYHYASCTSAQEFLTRLDDEPGHGAGVDIGVMPERINTGRSVDVSVAGALHRVRDRLPNTLRVDTSLPPLQPAAHAPSVADH